MGLALIFLPLKRVFTKVRERDEPQGVEAYIYLDGITTPGKKMPPGTVGVMPFFEPELAAQGIHLSPEKLVALAQKGDVLTSEHNHF